MISTGVCVNDVAREPRERVRAPNTDAIVMMINVHLEFLNSPRGAQRKRNATHVEVRIVCVVKAWQ
jgi:hypothetical protein